MENELKNFEDLKIWQDGVELAVRIYSALTNCRDFGLRDQMQRSSVSIPSNIAEGFDRNSNNEFIRFLKIAKGSCGELRTQLIIAERVKLIESVQPMIEQTLVLSKMIQKMITYRESLRK